MTAPVDFSLRTGERFAWDISAKQPDGTFLTWDGYSASLEIRVLPSDPSPVFTASTANGDITASGTSISIDVSGDDTATIPPTLYQYDLKVWSASDESDAEFIIAGTFRVLEAVTR